MIPKLWLRLLIFLALCVAFVVVTLPSMATVAYDGQSHGSVSRDKCAACGFDWAKMQPASESQIGFAGPSAFLAIFSEFLAAEGAGSEATGFLGSKNFELGNAVQAGDDVMVQGVCNTPTTINDIDYSGHALNQMQNRGVMPSVVENTINVGQQFPTRAGTVGYFDSVNNVRVIVNSQNGTVVTVIRGAP